MCTLKFGFTTIGAGPAHGAGLRVVISPTGGMGLGVKFKWPDIRGIFSGGRNDRRTDALTDPEAAESIIAGNDGKRYLFPPGTKTGDELGRVQIEVVIRHSHTLGKALCDNDITPTPEVDRSPSQQQLR